MIRAGKIKVAIQMDQIDTINIDTDSSFALALEAQKRGYEVFYYQPKDLSLQDGLVKASLRAVEFRRDKNNFFTLGNEFFSSFKEIDVVLMRQDPPFNMNYITYTYLLEKLPMHVRVINNPKSVRDCPEKLFVINFKEFMTPTLVTMNISEAEEFLHEHQEIIVKPLYAHAGNDVNKVTDITQLTSVFHKLVTSYGAPVMVQRFIKEVSLGDKRIIFINGEVVGAINRIPPEGAITSNTARGGKAVATELTKREHKICEALGPELKKRGLFLAGIDVINGYLNEINVTSPTGMQLIDRIYGTDLPKLFWDNI